MHDVDSHSVTGTERKLDCFSTLPDEILEKIFLELSLYDVMKLSLVCKRWDVVSRSSLVWKKFVPKYSGIHLPKADTQYGVFQKLWVDSLVIGKERWFPNPLPDLVDYDTALREEESKESGEIVESKCVLYLRLNPLYPFTTDGLNINDSAMVEAVQAIFNEFGHVHDNEDDPLIYDAKSSMDSSAISDKKFAMRMVLKCLESQTFLVFRRDPDRGEPELDEEGYRVKETLLQDGQNFVEELKNKSDKKKNRLDDKLFNQIRNILVGKNNQLVCYYLNDGCFGDTYTYARHLILSETAAVHCIQYYETFC